MQYKWQPPRSELVRAGLAVDAGAPMNRLQRRAAMSAARKKRVSILDGNATAAGLNRLFEGKNVKDTVKDNG